MADATPREQLENNRQLAAVLASVQDMQPEDAHHALSSALNLIVIGAKHQKSPREVYAAFLAASLNMLDAK